MPNLGRNRKNDLQRRLDRRRQVAELYLHGYSQMEIADELACSQPTVSNDLASLREQWIGSALRDFDQRKAEELAKLDELEREAWAAWQRSCQDAETSHLRIESARVAPAKAGKGKSKTTEKARLVLVRRILERTKKIQTGEPRFLDQVAWCIECRLKLMGLFRNVTDVRQVVNIDWEALSRPVPDLHLRDPLAIRLAELNKATSQPSVNGRILESP